MAAALVLAATAGKGWLRRALKAAKVVAAAQREEDDTAVEAKLLEHIRDAFLGTDRLKTSDLLDELRKRDDGPWAEMFDKTWDIDNAKSAARLARMLKPYGIRPRKPRFEDPDGETSQYSGYLSADFADAWSRWL